MKKNSLKKLLAYAFAVYASTAGLQSTSVAGVDTGLSFVKFPEFYNVKYAFAGGCHSLMQENSQREDAVGACVGVTLGMEQVWNGDRGSHKLAEGFGYNGQRTFNIKNVNESATLDLADIISVANPAYTNGTQTLKGSSYWNPVVNWGEYSMSLDAKHRRYFASLCYMQDLGQFYEGLTFYVTTAIVSVRNELCAVYQETKAPAFQSPTTLSNTNIVGTGSSTNMDADYVTALGMSGNTTSTPIDASKLSNGLTPEKFFNGEGNTTHPWNAQGGLLYGKISKASQSEVALNNIGLGLGLKVVDSENASVCVKLEGSIPTGRELKGDFLMEPQVGERHFKLGGAAYANACFAEGSDYKACVNLGGLWHYAFKRKGLRLPSATNSCYNQYALAYVAGDTVDARPVMNIIVEKIKGNLEVKPGSTLNACASASVEKGSLVFDLGYNFHYTQDEKVEFGSATLDNVYTLADNQPSSYKAQSGGKFVAPSSDSSKVALENFSFAAKSQALHNIAASIGFMCKDCNYPGSLSLIGGYEFAHNRQRTREVFSVALKGVVCF